MNRSDWYYLLGFGFLDFVRKDDYVVLSKSGKYKAMNEFAHQFGKRATLHIESKQSRMDINDAEFISFLNNHGALDAKKYLTAIADEYAWDFCAGYFDGYGEFGIRQDIPKLFLSSPIPSVINFISALWKVNNPSANRIIVNGYKVIDICGMMYENRNIVNRNTSLFWDLANAHFSRKDVDKKRFAYRKLKPEAIKPIKSRVTDSGWDLSITELVPLYSTAIGKVYEGRTHLAIRPYLGTVFDMQGRSGLPKSGWMFMQGIGIIDKSYQGGLGGHFLHLKDEPLPKLPWKALQIVLRDAPIHMPSEEVKDLGDTARGEHGFGSNKSGL